MAVSKQDLIHEDAKETAKKIRKVLKAKYPDTKFSVTSETYSMGSRVTASYRDGIKPDRSEINDFLRQFNSVTFDGMTDSSDVKGYEYEGKFYYGADYIFYSEY